MSIWTQLALIWLLAALMMLAGWWWQRRNDNAGIVDVLWASGLAGAALLLALLGDGAWWPRMLLAVCGGGWAARLAWHLRDRVFSEAEDGRYRHLRRHWQGNQGKFLLFFQFQAALIVLFALPFVAVASNTRVEPAWLVAGFLIWAASVLGESIADRQLARFRQQPGNKGKTCDGGLWRYSRHPNYFFEWLHWFAYVAMAVGAPLAWLAWCGPVIMYVFLRWISGIPFTEEQSLRSRGESYRDYQRRTPMLIPWFPKTDTAKRIEE
ncbi:MAG: DUF1295 domain-containing protein [Rhodanobacteraceae bacterium]